MECPKCQSNHIRKNGHRRGKQNYICVDCGRQFVANPKVHRGYSDDVRKMCLKISVNGMEFRSIERATDIHHTTVLNWVKLVGEHLPDAYAPEEIPEVGELDELKTFVDSQKTKSGSGQPSTTSNPAGYFILKRDFRKSRSPKRLGAESQKPSSTHGVAIAA